METMMQRVINRIHESMYFCGVLMFLSLPTLSGIASAAAVTGPENERCLICHSDKKMISMGGKHLFIDSSLYAATTHSYIRCNSCHTAISAIHPNHKPRPPKPTRATCRECHEPIHAEYSKSLHGSK